MPIYKQSEKKYLVRIHIAGKPKTKTVHGTRKDAENFEAKWRLDIAARGSTAYRSAPTFSSYCLEDYSHFAKSHLKPSTYRNRKYQIATLIEHFGTKPINRITPADVLAFQSHRLEADKVRASKVNDDIKVLKAILNHAREQGQPAIVPKVKRLPERGSKKRVVCWTEEQCQALLAAMQEKASHLVPITVALLNTGMRKGEALQLRWRDVDLEAGIIKIQPSEEWQPKNNKPREIPISDALHETLEAHKKTHKSVHCFPGTHGRRYKMWPQRDWDKAREHAKIPGSPHTCRHTYASMFLQAQPDMYLLAQILGHSHTRVSELYSHLLPDHLSRARNAVSIGMPGGAG